MTAGRPRINDEVVVQLTRAGLSATLIAETLGCSSRSVIRARVRTGVAKPGPRPFTADELERAKSLLEDGASLAEAARSIGRAEAGGIRRYFAQYAWSAEECQSYARFCGRMARVAAKTGRGGLLW